MYLQQLMLDIFQKFDGQRSETAAFHLICGKRSGQTIQDVGTFGLEAYFSIMPKLSKQQYLEAFEQLIENGWVFYDEQKALQLTTRGKDVLEKSNAFHFNGWFYRGNEHVFFKRLSLIVQTFSYVKVKDFRFNPIQKDEEIQAWVKYFLMRHPYKDPSFHLQFRNEIENSIKNLHISEQAKQIVMFRLTGFHLTGWTWQQLASQFDCGELDVQFMFVELLHTWLDLLTLESAQFPLLYRLTENIRIENLLTDSTQKTADLFKRGYSLEQIAMMRHLKTSTIEDHFVEMAMIIRDFPLHQFIDEADVEKVMDVLSTTESKRLKIIREQIPQFSYFQIRLVIAAKGGEYNVRA